MSLTCSLCLFPSSIDILLPSLQLCHEAAGPRPAACSPGTGSGSPSDPTLPSSAQAESTSRANFCYTTQ